MNDFLAEVASWPEGLRESFEERAAILEYDAGYDREEAEYRAYLLLRPAA